MNQNELLLSPDNVIGLLGSASLKKASLRFQVTGSSMYPFIKNGDIVTVSPPPAGDMSLGRAVAFVNPRTKKLAIHRIVGKKSDSYIIKGDAISSIDGFVPKKDILGCVSRVERGGKDFPLGLGIGRIMIAFLSKRNMLPLIFWFWNLIPHPVRKRIL